MIKYLKDLKKEEPKEIVVKLESRGFISHTSVCHGYEDVFSQLKWHDEKEDGDLFIKEISNRHVVLSTIESEKVKDESKDIEELEKIMNDSMGKIEDYIRGKSMKTKVYIIVDKDNDIKGLYNDEIKASLVKSSMESNGYKDLSVTQFNVE